MSDPTDTVTWAPDWADNRRLCRTGTEPGYHWRRGLGPLGDDGLWHYYTDKGNRLCDPIIGLGAGWIAEEGDPLCDRCVALTIGAGS